MSTPQLINTITRQRSIVEAQAMATGGVGSALRRASIFRAKVITVNATSPVTYEVRVLSGTSDTETSWEVDGCLPTGGAYQVGDTVLLHINSPEPPTIFGQSGRVISTAATWQDFNVGSIVPSKSWPLPSGGTIEHGFFAVSPDTISFSAYGNNRQTIISTDYHASGTGAAFQFYIPYLTGTVISGFRIAFRTTDGQGDTDPPALETGVDVAILKVAISDPEGTVAGPGDETRAQRRCGVLVSGSDLDAYKAYSGYEGSMSDERHRLYQWDDLYYEDDSDWESSDLTLDEDHVYLVEVKVNNATAYHETEVAFIGLKTSKRVY